MKNLYNEADKNEILNRLENLKVDAVRQWGKMKETHSRRVGNPAMEAFLPSSATIWSIMSAMLLN